MSEMSQWRSLKSENGQFHYRKFSAHKMLWPDSIDLRHFVVAAAPYGGPIAMVMDRNSIIPLAKGKGEQTQPMLYIRSAAGELLAKIKWDPPPGDHLVCFKWTLQEQLVAVFEKGCVAVFDVHGKSVQRTLVLEASGNKDSSRRVIDCSLWSGGLVLLVCSGHNLVDSDDNVRYELLVVEHIQESYPGKPLIYPLPLRLDPGVQPLCLVAVVGRMMPGSKLLEALVSTSNASVYVVSHKACVRQHNSAVMGAVSICMMAVSIRGNLVACLSEDGMLRVLSSDFGHNYLELDTTTKSSHRHYTSTMPRQLVWCGRDSLVMYWENESVLMIGPKGDSLFYSEHKTADGQSCLYSKERILLVPEVDCVRIISNKETEILQRVPEAIVHTRTKGSTSPSALLFEAWNALASGEARANENVQILLINNTLEEAVKMCCTAACAEFSVPMQQKYLRAVSYGKNFCQTPAVAIRCAEAFVTASQNLRAINNLRHAARVHMPLTLHQYTRLSPEVILRRLANRHQHLLAINMAKFVGSAGDKNTELVEELVMHWAQVKLTIESEQSDLSLCKMITARLKELGLSCYASVAQVAATPPVNNPALAKMLLQNEDRPVNKVPLLLSMNHQVEALEVSLESGDTDLVHAALQHIKMYYLAQRAAGRQKPSEVLQTIFSNDRASTTFVRYFREHDIPFLKQVFMEQCRFEDTGMLLVYEAMSPAPTPATRPAAPTPEGVAPASLSPSSQRSRPRTKSVGHFRPLAVRFRQLKLAADMFSKGVQNGNASLKFLYGVTQRQVVLYDFQNKMMAITKDDRFKGATVVESIFLCTSLGKDEEAEWLRVNFNVPERIFWHEQVRGLSHVGKWKELNRLSHKKKNPPIGFLPFAEACYKAEQITSCKAYIKRMREKEQMLAYEQFRMWEDAFDVAIKNKDSRGVQRIMQDCDKHLQAKFLQKFRQSGLY